MKTLEQFEKETEIHFTKNHTGKMQGFLSLSTSVTCNPNCKRNAKKKNSICSKCYAARMCKRYKNLEVRLLVNTAKLCGRIYRVEDMPTLNVRFFRFESFGDLNNTTQVQNYFNLCKANKNTTFALWTKNPHIIAQAIDAGAKKPKNLIIILSSLFINKPVNTAGAVKYDFVDKVFTVYDKDFATRENIHINCGARNCLECGRCYSKKTSFYVNELLK